MDQFFTVPRVEETPVGGEKRPVFGGNPGQEADGG
jgi:hypothetical protein